MNKIEILQKKHDALKLAVSQLNKELKENITFPLMDEETKDPFGFVTYDPADSPTLMGTVYRRAVCFHDNTPYRNHSYFPVESIPQLIKALQFFISEEG